MTSRRWTIVVLLVGVLVLAIGGAAFFAGRSAADDATADLALARDAHRNDEEDVVATRELDRQIENALIDARLHTTSMDPTVARALEDSRLHRQRLGEVLDVAERADSAMRGNDAPAYNQTVDEHNAKLDQAEALWLTVNATVGDISELLAQVYASYDEALLEAGR